MNDEKRLQEIYERTKEREAEANKRIRHYWREVFPKDAETIQEIRRNEKKES